jgi:hypothetical protein
MFGENRNVWRKQKCLEKTEMDIRNLWGMLGKNRNGNQKGKQKLF